MAMALPRSLASVKTFVRIDSVDGMISAPPMPMKARAAMSWVAEPDSAEQIDPVVKIRMPVRRASLRPKRSPSVPQTRRRPAKTSR
jgi:hypothetical protein